MKKDLKYVMFYIDHSRVITEATFK